MRFGMDRSSWIESAKACAAAFQFMTRLPVRINLQYTDDLFRRSVVYYPVVGAVIGLLLAASALAAEWLVPVFTASVLVVGVWVAVTGALHLDGLMDTADGLLSHRSRERMLEIMKDSRVGAMGVIAGVLALLLKYSLLITVLSLPNERLAFLVAAPIWSRWFVVWAIASWPYARAEQGLGSLFAAVTRSEARTATVWAFALSLLAFLLFGLPWWAAIGYTAVASLLAGLLGFWLARGMARKLGGLTGDTYGAMAELLECVLLLLVTIISLN